MLQRIIRGRTAVLLLMIVVFAGCRVGKNYEQPALTLPERFNGVAYSDTASVADLKWKTFFTDKTLQGLIEKGISHNQDLLIAVKRTEIAQRQLRQSRLLQLPEANFQITAQTNNPSNNSLNGISAKSFLGKSHIENYLAMASLSWEVDVWGKIRRQKEIALSNYLSTYEAVKAVQTQVVANIAQGYFNLLMLDQQLAIARRNLGLTDSFATATRLLKNAGETTALAVQQAEARKLTTAQLIPQLEESIALQENALQVLTGQLPGTISRTSTLREIRFPSNISTGLPAAMVSRRPDVRASEIALQVANSQVGIAQANMYPALNISAGAGLETFQSSNWFNIPASLFGLAAGTIAQPIFRRGELKTKYDVAKLQREQSVIEFRQSVLKAVGEVSNALVQVEKLKDQEAIARAQVDTLQRAVFNAQLLFKSDMANYLEVITAQSSSLEVELGLASLRSRQLTAVVDLYRSLGGGWE